MGVSLADVYKQNVFPLTNLLENRCLPIDSSGLLLKGGASLSVASCDVIKLQCSAAQGKTNFLLKTAVLRAAHILSLPSVGTRVLVAL